MKIHFKKVHYCKQLQKLSIIWFFGKIEDDIWQMVFERDLSLNPIEDLISSFANPETKQILETSISWMIFNRINSVLPICHLCGFKLL